MTCKSRPATVLLSCLIMALGLFILGQGVARAASIDAALNVMGYDREVAIKINGTPISKIVGGQSHSVRLFVTDDPRIKEFPPQMQKSMQELFCLKEGENRIEIAFKEKGKPTAPSRFTVSIEAGNYPVPVLEYAANPEVREGRVQGTFAVYPQAPAGFTTVVLK